MEGAQFNFFAQGEKQSPLSNKKVLDKLMQWSMKGNIKIKHYNFNQQFHPYQKQDFINAFFKDPNVFSTLEVYCLPSLSWNMIGNVVERVEYELVPANETSMSFFDRLLDPHNNIVRERGEIRQSLDDEIDGFIVANHLRLMLLDVNSEFYDLYTPSERHEFIFRLLLHFALGGQWCQWDDVIHPYLDILKTFYKDLLSVEREEGKNKIRIRSVILKVKCYDDQDQPVFPANPDNIQNFCYLIIDPIKRTVTVFTHYYGAALTV